MGTSPAQASQDTGLSNEEDFAAAGQGAGADPLPFLFPSLHGFNNTSLSLLLQAQAFSTNFLLDPSPVLSHITCCPLTSSSRDFQNLLSCACHLSPDTGLDPAPPTDWPI